MSRNNIRLRGRSENCFIVAGRKRSEKIVLKPCRVHVTHQRRTREILAALFVDSVVVSLFVHIIVPRTNSLCFHTTRVYSVLVYKAR